MSIDMRRVGVDNDTVAVAANAAGPLLPPRCVIGNSTWVGSIGGTSTWVGEEYTAANTAAGDVECAAVATDVADASDVGELR